MSALVCAPQNGFAPVTLQNRTTGLCTSIGLPKRADMTNDGMSAEWIVEGISPDLPDFGAIVFLECLGLAASHRLELERGTKTEIISSAKDLTETEVARPSEGPAWTIIVYWKGIR
jgi:Peptidase A4 family